MPAPKSEAKKKKNTAVKATDAANKGVSSAFLKAAAASASCHATKCRAEEAAGKLQAARVRSEAMRIMASKAPAVEVKRDLKALMDGIMASDITANLLRCKVSRCNSQLAGMYAAMCAGGACAGMRVPGHGMTYEDAAHFNAELVRNLQKRAAKKPR
jgi:hypothetical protein